MWVNSRCAIAAWLECFQEKPRTVSEWTGLPGEESVKRFERSNGLDTALYKTTPLPFYLLNKLAQVSKAVPTPVPVANRTLANGTLEPGLRSHEIKIDRPRPVRVPFDDFAVSTLRPEHEWYWPNSMSLISEWQAEIISHFSKLGDNLLAGLCFFSGSFKYM